MTPTPLSHADRTLSWYIRAIRDLGFPILVAAILLWVVLKDVPGNAAAARRDVAEARAQLANHMGENRLAMQELSVKTAEQTLRLLRVMQQICVNTAGTADERDRCFPQ